MNGITLSGFSNTKAAPAAKPPTGLWPKRGQDSLQPLSDSLSRGSLRNPDPFLCYAPEMARVQAEEWQPEPVPATGV